MGIPLSKGRMFTQNDTANTDPVVIVNEAFVRKFGGAQGPLGRKMFVNFRTQTPVRIVGVVSAVRHDKVHIATFPAVYVPHAQVPVSSMTLAVRSAGDPIAILSVVRQRIREVEPLAPVYNVRTMSQVVNDSTGQSRFLMLLLVLFAAVAVLLAAVGIYGVISYSVSQRMHEMGIRIALGAQSHSLFRLIFTQGMAPVLTGMVIGTVASFVLSRFLESMLFGVSAADPIVFLSVAGLLTVVALLACYVPARRATKVDPMVALRYE